MVEEKLARERPSVENGLDREATESRMGNKASRKQQILRRSGWRGPDMRGLKYGLGASLDGKSGEGAIWAEHRFKQLERSLQDSPIGPAGILSASKGARLIDQALICCEENPDAVVSALWKALHDRSKRIEREEARSQKKLEESDPLARVIARRLLRAAESLGDESKDSVWARLLEPMGAAGIRSLLSEGANPRARSAGNRSPISIAATAGDFEGVSELLRWGADPNGEAWESASPLWRALEGMNERMFDFLEKNGAQAPRARAPSELIGKVVGRIEAEAARPTGFWGYSDAFALRERTARLIACAERLMMIEHVGDGKPSAGRRRL